MYTITVHWADPYYKNLLFSLINIKNPLGIANLILVDSSDEDPFSASGSEYSASSEDTETSSEDDTCVIEEYDTSEQENIKTPLKKIKPLKTPSKNIQKKSQHNYVIKTDEYFSNQSQKKAQTSNHTLDKLNTPRLSQDQLQVLLKNMKISKEHEQCITTFSDNYKSYFHKWLYLLHEDFNILLYGLGSKRNILQQFHAECLSDMPVIVINGFFPSLTLKDIIDAIIIDILGRRESISNLLEACDLIAQEFKMFPSNHLYLIIHNIEGDMLRNTKIQTALSKLAVVKNIHLIASIDHINAPLS